MYVDMGGVENVAVRIVSQARKDFIKGAKILYCLFGKIPTEKELLKDQDHKTLSTLGDIREMYDAWRFVRNDPYDMFGEIGEDSVIRSWMHDSIMSYYRELYLKGASILYKSKGTKEIYDIADSSVKKKLKDKSTSEDFIAARNYIYSLDNGKSILDEWNKVAYERSKRNSGRKGRIKIQDTAWAKKMKEEKAKNKETAWSFYQSGMTPLGIAKYMNMHVATINKYIREKKDELAIS